MIDGVSRDGVYKVVAIWEYDKRSVNGAHFVYFGMRLRTTEDPKIRSIVRYAAQVVAALDVLNGPTHMEVMLCPDGPCLVEVGSRCHGGGATWLPVVQECIGYNAMEVTLNAFLRPDRFDALPAEPILLKQGCEVFLVATCSGTLKDLVGLDTIRELPSFRWVTDL